MTHRPLVLLPIRYRSPRGRGLSALTSRNGHQSTDRNVPAGRTWSPRRHDPGALVVVEAGEDPLHPIEPPARQDLARRASGSRGGAECIERAIHLGRGCPAHVGSTDTCHRGVTLLALAATPGERFAGAPRGLVDASIDGHRPGRRSARPPPAAAPGWCRNSRFEAPPQPSPALRRSQEHSHSPDRAVAARRGARRPRRTRARTWSTPGPAAPITRVAPVVRHRGPSCSACPKTISSHRLGTVSGMDTWRRRAMVSIHRVRRWRSLV